MQFLLLMIDMHLTVVNKHAPGRKYRVTTHCLLAKELPSVLQERKKKDTSKYPVEIRLIIPRLVLPLPQDLLISKAAQISKVMSSSCFMELCVFVLRLCHCISCPSQRRSFRRCSPCYCHRKAVCLSTHPSLRLEMDAVL